MPELAVNFSIVLSPKASDLIRNLGAPRMLLMATADTLNRVNQECVAEIVRVLNVQGKGAGYKGSPRGIKESKSHNYDYPHKVSGKLQKSIGRTNAVIDPGKVSSALGSGVGHGVEAVRYAAAQEYGGEVSVPSRPSRAKKYRATYTMTQTKYQSRKTGRFIAAPMTKAYKINIPARSYVYRTVTAMKDEWPRSLSRTVKRFYGGQN